MNKIIKLCDHHHFIFFDQHTTTLFHFLHHHRLPRSHHHLPLLPSHHCPVFTTHLFHLLSCSQITTPLHHRPLFTTTSWNPATRSQKTRCWSSNSNFILTSDYRGGLYTFAVILVSKKHDVILPDQGYNRVYTYVVNCTFLSPIGDIRSGGTLFHHASTSGGGDATLTSDEGGFWLEKLDLESSFFKFLLTVNDGGDLMLTNKWTSHFLLILKFDDLVLMMVVVTAWCWSRKRIGGWVLVVVVLVLVVNNFSRGGGGDRFLRGGELVMGWLCSCDLQIRTTMK